MRIAVGLIGLLMVLLAVLLSAKTAVHSPSSPASSFQSQLSRSSEPVDIQPNAQDAEKRVRAALQDAEATAQRQRDTADSQ